MASEVKKQQGQTLIETIVAIFVLVMGITAALSLANYSLGATTSIKQQIIGMGLAREGIEVIKNMRDTNWLKVPYDTNCYNFANPSESDGICYRNWLNTAGGYNISPGPVGSPQSYILRFSNSSNNPMPWSAVPNDDNFGLDSTPGTGVLYNVPSTPVAAPKGTSGFARKITIAQDTFAPFNQTTSTGARIKVTSQVWWSGKNCTLTVQPNPSKNCSVTLETYLTNWRVF